MKDLEVDGRPTFKWIFEKRRMTLNGFICVSMELNSRL